MALNPKPPRPNHPDAFKVLIDEEAVRMVTTHNMVAIYIIDQIDATGRVCFSRQLLSKDLIEDPGVVTELVFKQHHHLMGQLETERLKGIFHPDA